MNIFEFTDYGLFLKNWLQAQAKQGRGLARKWAQELGLHPTFLSQVLLRKRELNLEHAESLSALLNLTEVETDYFILLVMHARAGTDSLRKRLKRKILAEQARTMQIGARLNVRDEVDEDALALFYSSWLYSGVRNLTALEGFQTSDAMAEHLKIPRALIQEIIDFLIKKRLCIKTDDGVRVGPSRTHVKADSPHVQRHHQNWRLQAIQKMTLKGETDTYFTFPFSASVSDCEKIRRLIPGWTEQVHKIVGPSPSETVRCLNLDFFSY